MLTECRGSSWSLYIRSGAAPFVLAILTDRYCLKFTDGLVSSRADAVRDLLSVLKVVNLVQSRQKTFNARN